MKNIILTGYMCVGKTTVGKALAKRIGKTFYDLDWYIEGRRHQRISEIFEQYGEQGFRNIERNMLHELVEFEDIVLSCGGGTPCFYDNMERMNEKGITVYLKASPQTIATHYKMSHVVRPLLKDKNEDELQGFIEKQLMERSPFYEQAQHVVNVDVLDSANRINEIVECILNCAES